MPLAGSPRRERDRGDGASPLSPVRPSSHPASEVAPSRGREQEGEGTAEAGWRRGLWSFPSGGKQGERSSTDRRPTHFSALAVEKIEREAAASWGEVLGRVLLQLLRSILCYFFKIRMLN